MGTRELCLRAVEEVSSLPGDVLFRHGKQAKMMYFLASGVLDYIHMDLDPRLTQMLAAGQWASELVLWVQWVHCGNLRASTSCEVLTLDAAMFRDIVLGHSQSLDFAKRYAKLLIEYVTDVEHEA